jgi:hypothetical protein
MTSNHLGILPAALAALDWPRTNSSPLFRGFPMQGAEVNPGFSDWGWKLADHYSSLIFAPRPIDPMWLFACASDMHYRHIQARVQRTPLRKNELGNVAC